MKKTKIATLDGDPEFLFSLASAIKREAAKADIDFSYLRQNLYTMLNFMGRMAEYEQKADEVVK